MVKVVVVGAVDVFLDNGIYYFIVRIYYFIVRIYYFIVMFILFYCDVYIILLC